MSHATGTRLKTVGYTAGLLVLLAIANFVALSFVAGFAAGFASSNAPTVMALGLVAAAVWVGPFNYAALQRILD